MKNIIEVSHYSKSYKKVKAVRDISFQISKGSMIGFIGKNGAGKTTTIRGMMNLIKPSGGKIQINKLDSRYDAKEIRKYVGYMPGESNFYENLKSIDILKFCASIEKSPIENFLELAKYFQLDVNKKISELSLGNRKKLSIIQALAQEKEVLILDEPTSGLDPFMQKRFFELLLKYKKKGKTIFLSSHNLSDVEKYCDRAIIIENGTIVEDINLEQYKKNQVHIVEYKTKDGEEKKFQYQDDLNKLIVELSRLSLQELKIRPASIEDEFIKYFGGEDE